MHEQDSIDSVSIIVEGVPDPAIRKNRQSTTHWDRYRAVKAAKDVAYLLWREQPLPETPFEKARISVVQWFCGRGIDAEGLASGVSPAVDSAVDIGIIPSDDPHKVIQGFELSYKRVPHKDQRQYKVTITRA
tara:strand:+ start:343 stop:738 length:396 start_codon:yes stop_codon:yes gene_type:complete